MDNELLVGSYGYALVEVAELHDKYIAQIIHNYSVQQPYSDEKYIAQIIHNYSVQQPYTDEKYAELNW